MTYQRLLRVSILGPVSTISKKEEASQLLNVRRMCSVANDIVQLGLVPHVPALCGFWHMLQPLPRELWLLISQNEIARSNACYRMPGPSAGADAEIEFAEGLGIPVFYSMQALADWAVGHSLFVARALLDGVPGYTEETEPFDPLENSDFTMGVVDALVDRGLTKITAIDLMSRSTLIATSKTANEVAEMLMRGSSVLFDEDDGTFHMGDGKWAPFFGRAQIYMSQTEAEQMLDEVDGDAILRDRLVILSVSEAKERIENR